MRRAYLGVLTAALCFTALPAFGHDTKRTDACGCHHQWGLRHCHPKLKTPRCEAPAAKDELTSPKKELPPPSPKAIRI